MAKSAPLPGTADVFPEESRRWRELEEIARGVFTRYGYGELRTPIFEATEVFQRGLGNETEVVRKEMYTFEDRGGRSVTLRPEGTAGVMRALLATDVLNGVEQRVFYYGPMFRGERPAAGRRRQFHQVGVENVGRVAPELDAECIAMLIELLTELGLGDAELKINTRGVQSDRPAAAQAIRDYFRPYLNELCDDCKARFEGNIWRILDCKQEHCREIIKGIPDYVGFFSDESKVYFDRVLHTLDLMGIRYTVDPFLVRGLDYYVHTVFELTHTGLGAQNAIAGGGRYELLLPGETKPVMGVGFAAGMERLMLARESKGIACSLPTERSVFIASLGSAANDAKLQLTEELRKEGFCAGWEIGDKSLKAQLRAANRQNAAAAVILGDDELARNVVMLRDLAGGEQREVPRAQLAAELAKLNVTRIRHC